MDKIPDLPYDYHHEVRETRDVPILQHFPAVEDLRGKLRKFRDRMSESQAGVDVSVGESDRPRLPGYGDPAVDRYGHELKTYMLLVEKDSPETEEVDDAIKEVEDLVEKLRSDYEDKQRVVDEWREKREEVMATPEYSEAKRERDGMEAEWRARDRAFSKRKEADKALDSKPNDEMGRSRAGLRL